MTNATSNIGVAGVNASDPEIAKAPVVEHRDEGKTRRIVLQVVKQVVVFVFAIMMLYPILWMIASSLRRPDEIFTNMGLWVS
ncbi:ABC transporter, permease protein, partial [Bifidobacterium avesanii]